MMHALTVRGNNGGMLSAIISDVGVSLPFLGGVQTTIAPFKGIWDTGATGSVITQSVVNQVGLKPTGQKMVNYALGRDITNTYLVNLYLPMNVTIQNVTVTEGKLPEGVDLLVGMDVITLGDFSITNKNRNTVMSFRFPSSVCHDYVPEANNHNRLEAFKTARKPKHTATKKKKGNRRKRR